MLGVELSDQFTDQCLERLRVIGECGSEHGQSVPIQHTDASAFMR
jgi:hypothetical protein